MRRRLLALLLLAAVVAGACGGSQEESDAADGRYGSSEPDPGTSTEEGRPSTDSGGTDDEEAGASTPGRQSPAGSQPRQPGRSGGSGGSPSGDGSQDGASRTTGGSASPVRVGSYGSLARTILSRTGASTLVVEIQQQAPPRPGTVDYVVGVLRDVSGKTVERPAPISVTSDDTVWTADEIRAAADRFGRAQQTQSTGVIRLLFLRGRFEEESALGVAVRGDVAAVFGEQVTRASQPLLSPSVVEQAVATHELGHLLGLVDVVRKTGRADPEHPEHSRNPQSVMYWAVESDLLSQALGGEPSRQFDREDLADLAALRDGG